MRSLIAATIGIVLSVTTAIADTAFQEQMLSVPMVDGRGDTHHLAGRLCLPSGATSDSRLALINHGSSGNSERPRMLPGQCTSEIA